MRTSSFGLRWRVGSLLAWMLVLLLGGTPSVAASQAASGPVAGYVSDYVAAVNGVDPAVVARFATVDLSADFDQPHATPVVQRFFASQRRLTGGITALGFRYEDAAQTRGVFAFKDAIYGGVRAVEFNFDATPERRITSFTFVSAPDWATASQAKLTPAQVASRAARRIERGCRAGVFSGAFLVAYRQRVLVQRACGEASQRYHAANQVSTRFNIGSMNKMFTAVAVAQLVEQGRVSLADPLGKFLDETWLARPILDQVTVGELLSMTSGLQDYFDAAPFASLQMNRTLDAYKPLFRGLKVVAAPGAGYVYSDTAYFLLGLVVQKSSGEDYYDYIRRHIYAPAGMTSTDSYALDGPAPDLATGYVYSPSAKGWSENLTGVSLRGTPDGGGYSTVGDLRRFAEALASGKLVKPASLALLLRDHRPPSGTGFYVLDTPAGRIVGKDGFGPGISAEMDLYLDAGWLVVSLSNYDDGARAPLEATRADIFAVR